MSKFLFLFSVGPVKEFVSQSRKAHDLFAASKLLSFLCKTGARKLIELNANDEGIIITPKFDWTKIKIEIAPEESYPNRFLAKLETTEDQLNLMGRTVEETVLRLFVSTADVAKPFSGDNIGWDQQIKSFLEIHWLFVPLSNEENYRQQYQKIETQFAAIKQSKIFSQFNYQPNKLGEAGRKCNLDGIRNVMVYREAIAKENTSFKLSHNSGVKIMNITERPVWAISPGEGLSAVSYTKRRFLQKPHLFPSTAKVALWKLLHETKNLESMQRLNQLVEGDPDNDGRGKILPHSNDELYFEENIRLELFKKSMPAKDESEKKLTSDEATPEQKLMQFKSAFKYWKDEMESNEIGADFTKYYALVAADGDSMGKHLIGSYLKKEKEGSLLPFHRDLTAQLGEYASQNMLSIQKPNGQTIYAGGEDFLGFFNLHFLFLELGRLFERFQKVNEDMERYSTVSLTLSAGIVIAHYKEPLSVVLKQTAKLEHLAKEEGGNRLAIMVNKHAGSELICVFEWRYLPVLKDVLTSFNIEFSGTFVTKLFDLYDMLQNNIGLDFHKLEMKRLINRSYAVRKKDDQTKEVYSTQRKKAVDALTENLWILFDEGVNWTNYKEMLGICDFFSRKVFMNKKDIADELADN